MHKKILPVLVCLSFLIVTGAHATADGPDYYQVVGVASDDVLNMRTGPAAKSARIGSIPAGTNGIVNFGCTGGLSFEDWQSATEEERAAALKTRWCLVGYDRTIGWSAGWYLNEGSGPDTLNAGGRLSGLTGSEWQLRDLAGKPVSAEAWINFSSDGKAFGDSGCNRFNGAYTENRNETLMGPIAMTRRACAGDAGQTEAAFMTALTAANRVVATHLVLALFDDDMLLATLTRRDAD